MTNFKSGDRVRLKPLPLTITLESRRLFSHADELDEEKVYEVAYVSNDGSTIFFRNTTGFDAVWFEHVHEKQIKKLFDALSVLKHELEEEILTTDDVDYFLVLLLEIIVKDPGIAEELLREIKSLQGL
jgi:hypothetical protein